ncbi:MAG: signal peptidase I [Clostridiales bacterium]|nr:signal peptidase I [Clostridiales bacterium]
MRLGKKRKITSIISTVFLVLSLIVLLTAVIVVLTGAGNKFLFGYKPYVISTGSMEPEYKVNCIVVIHKKSYEDIEVGDIVAFKAKEIGEKEAMHRVVEKTSNGFITKGDNNENVDDIELTKDEYIGHSVWHTNKLSGYLNLLEKPNGILKYMILPLGGIILLVISLKIFISLLFGGKNNSTENLEETSDENLEDTSDNVKVEKISIEEDTNTNIKENQND